jgi:hypothetical protein
MSCHKLSTDPGPSPWPPLIIAGICGLIVLIIWLSSGVLPFGLGGTG